MELQRDNMLDRRLTKLKKERKVTYRAMEAGTGIYSHTLVDLFSGKTRKPQEGTLEKLAEFFDVTVDWLRYGKDAIPLNEYEIKLIMLSRKMNDKWKKRLVGVAEIILEE
jgi:transcriptional regulator with XRE-family HTH domain